MTGTTGQRAFWVTLASTWLVMLVITVRTQADHVLIVPAWGILVSVLGSGVLVDRQHVVHSYQRGLPAGLSAAYVRGIVTVSGVVLTVIGILVTTFGCIRISTGL